MCKILQWSLSQNVDEREIKCGHNFNYDGKTRSAMFIWAKHSIAFLIITILSGWLNWSCFWKQPQDFSFRITMWRFISVCTWRLMCKKNSHRNWIFAWQNNTEWALGWLHVHCKSPSLGIFVSSDIFVDTINLITKVTIVFIRSIKKIDKFLLQHVSSSDWWVQKWYELNLISTA